MATETKPIGDRVRECVTIWRKLTVDLKIPANVDGMGEIKEQIDNYIKSGEAYTGDIPVPMIQRVAHVIFPASSRKPVNITLSVMKE
jgi:hypothetical protein